MPKLPSVSTAFTASWVTGILLLIVLVESHHPLITFVVAVLAGLLMNLGGRSLVRCGQADKAMKLAVLAGFAGMLPFAGWVHGSHFIPSVLLPLACGAITMFVLGRTSTNDVAAQRLDRFLAWLNSKGMVGLPFYRAFSLSMIMGPPRTVHKESFLMRMGFKS